MGLKLVGEVALDGSGWNSGLRGLERSTKSMMGGLKGWVAGAFGATAIKAAVQTTIDYASTLSDTAARLDISTTALQQWQYAAKMGGASADSLTGFFERLAAAQDSALGGNESTIRSFAALGITLRDLSGSNTEAIALKIAAAFRVGAGDARGMANALREVGGRGAGALLPAMKAGLEDAFEEAKRLSLVLDPEIIEKLDRLGDKWDIMGLKIKALVAGPVTDLAELVEAIVLNISKGIPRAWEEAKNIAFEKGDKPGGGSPIKQQAQAAGLLFGIGPKADVDRVRSAGTLWQKEQTDAFERMREGKNAAGSARGGFPGGGGGSDAYNKRNNQVLERLSQLNWDAASPDQKRSELDKQINAGEAWQSILQSLPEFLQPPELATNELALSIAQLKTQRAALPEPDGGVSAMGMPTLPQTDSLLRVGNFLGAGKDVVSNLGERQLSAMEKVAQNTQQLLEYTRNTPRSTTTDDNFPDV